VEPGASTRLKYVFSASHLCGPKGQDNLAQGLPWVSQKNVFSPEGAQGWEMRMAWIGGQSLPYGNGPFRAHSVGEINPG
jgi:hypothetical protein